MDFIQFKNKYLGQQVADPLLAGVKPYTDVALIKRYLKEVHGITATYWGEANEYWTKPNPTLLSAFDQLETTDVQESDIVITSEHISLGTGNTNSAQAEVLEQDGDKQTGEGEDGDVIRLIYLPKNSILGVLRPRNEVQPVIVPTPVEQAELPKPYKAPTAGLKVRLHLEKLYLKVTVPTYGSAMAAASHTKPKDKPLHPGSYHTDLTKLGMQRIVVQGANDETWINPADNVVEKKEVPSIVPAPDKAIKSVVRPPQIDYQPELDGVKEAEANYRDFVDETSSYLIEKKYRANPGGAFVLDFATGATSRMPAGSSYVKLAGYTNVGNIGYGIATNCLEDKDGNRLENPKWVGIMLGQLHEDVPPTRTLSLSDVVTEKSTKTIKKIMDVIRK